jgi:arylsulfatase A-like enzyme
VLVCLGIILIMVDDRGGRPSCLWLDKCNPESYHDGQKGNVLSQFYNNVCCCPARMLLTTGPTPYLAGIRFKSVESCGLTRRERHVGLPGQSQRQSRYVRASHPRCRLSYVHDGQVVPFRRESERCPLQFCFDKYYGCISGGRALFDTALVYQ